MTLCCWFRIPWRLRIWWNYDCFNVPFWLWRQRPRCMPTKDISINTVCWGTTGTFTFSGAHCDTLWWSSLGFDDAQGQGWVEWGLSSKCTPNIVHRDLGMPALGFEWAQNPILDKERFQIFKCWLESYVQPFNQNKHHLVMIYCSRCFKILYNSPKFHWCWKQLI